MSSENFYRFVQQIELASITYRFLLDVASVLILGLVMFYRRHKNRDILAMLFTFNIGIFVVLTVITSEQVSVGVGFGLFAILSIIRLRSGAVDNVQLSYLFMTLVLGLVNGFGDRLTPVLVILNVLVLLAVYLGDLNLNRKQKQIETQAAKTLKKMSVVLDQAISNDEQALEILSERFDYNIQRAVVESVDFVQNRSKVRFYYLAQSDPEVEEAKVKSSNDQDDDD